MSIFIFGLYHFAGLNIAALGAPSATLCMSESRGEGKAPLELWRPDGVICNPVEYALHCTGQELHRRAVASGGLEESRGECRASSPVN